MMPKELLQADAGARESSSTGRSASGQPISLAGSASMPRHNSGTSLSTSYPGTGGFFSSGSMARSSSSASLLANGSGDGSTYVLKMWCKNSEHHGIVHKITGFLLTMNADIHEASQYHDPNTDLFFMRVEFYCSDSSIEDLDKGIARATEGERAGIKWDFHDRSLPMKAVIMVSQEGHCLNDLLFRWKSGLLHIDIVAVISNHRDFYQLAASYNIPFHHIPVTKFTKKAAEHKQLEILQNEGAELVILARYMQIVSQDMCELLQGKIINIHHSFLPSFMGSKPYHQAHSRGVKLIGATAHYVTADLDEGPIIEQDVSRVDHSKTAQQLQILGKDTESQVLARAVKWHTEHRIFLNDHKTVIFK